MAFSKKNLDAILKDYHGPDDFCGPEGSMKQLTKALVERTMEAELTGLLVRKRVTKVKSKSQTAATAKVIKS
jgi:hypothetical protein